MKRYKNIILLVGMLLMAIYIGGAVDAISNGFAEIDNQKMAAQTCGITLHIMKTPEDGNGNYFLINIVNNAQYPADCLNESFLLQYKKAGEQGDEWIDIPVRAEKQEGMVYSLPSGANRSFVFYLSEDAETFELPEGEYRITKDITRDVGEDKTYTDLALTLDFSWPEIQKELAAYGKEVKEEGVASKLARTMLPEQIGMEDYWNPVVSEATEEDRIYLSQEDTGTQWWKVTFPAEAGTAYTAMDEALDSYRQNPEEANGLPVESWNMYVEKSTGKVAGPVILIAE